jgi:hypothetical protein
LVAIPDYIKVRPTDRLARAEGRHIKKCPDNLTLFKTLAAWYLELPEVKSKRSYDRDQRSVTLPLG